MATRGDIISETIPAKAVMNINTTLDEMARSRSLTERRMYLYGEIGPIDDDVFDFSDMSPTSRIVNDILAINREDRDIDPDDRIPIMLYINSPGGEINEGFSLISAIELSKTPIYTVNMGEWSSMAFLIGIAGDRRFSMPYSTFLMHDGISGAFGSTNKVQDRVKFEERFEQDVVKAHVLRHSKMESIDYDRLARVELYMLSDEALMRGFIDEIVTDIDTIL